MFKFRAVWARTQPFLSRSMRNGATNPDSNAENGQLFCNSQYRHERAKDTGTGTGREVEWAAAAEAGNAETQAEFENPVAADGQSDAI